MVDVFVSGFLVRVDDRLMDAVELHGAIAGYAAEGFGEEEDD